MRNFNLRKLIPIAILSTSLSFNFAQANSNFNNDLGLSEYKYFIIFPHLDRAYNALAKNDETTALKEFEKSHELAPDNIPLMLHLLEAYKHFGKNNLAEAFIEQQTSNNPALASQLNAIFYDVATVDTNDKLLMLSQKCSVNPTPECLYFIGIEALKLDDIELALVQLDNISFASSQQGKDLNNEILQKAIYREDWALADQILFKNYQSNQLTPKDFKIWFHVLLAGQLDSRIQHLQALDIFNQVDEQLDYFNTLHQRKATELLRSYLNQPIPTFQNAEQEKGWLSLIYEYIEKPEVLMNNYTVQFADNQSNFIDIMLPLHLKNKDFERADLLLKDTPLNQFLDERYQVTLNTHNEPNKIAELSQQLYARDPKDIKQLDEITWNLINTNQNELALKLLLEQYPFMINATDSDILATSQILINRLFALINQYPNSISYFNLAQLSQPLADPQIRMQQSQLVVFNQNCRVIENLLKDVSPNYDANTLLLLATCYQKHSPTLALQLLESAAKRQSSAYVYKAIAHQAATLNQLPKALKAWQAVPPKMMTDQDLIAAATIALTLNDTAIGMHWLNQVSQQARSNNSNYWQLRVQGTLNDTTETALDELTTALNIQPSIYLYKTRANLLRDLGDIQGSANDLMHALALDPNDNEAQLSLGYALRDIGQIQQSGTVMEKAHSQQPNNVELNKHLAYVYDHLNNPEKVQSYARFVIDDYYQQQKHAPLSPQDNQTLFDFRRMHENTDRRWTFSFNTSLGLNSGGSNAVSTGMTDPSLITSSNEGRSYLQAMAEYKIGQNQIIDGDTLYAYGRLSGDTGRAGAVIPTKHPVLGLGLRWKPFKNYIFFLTAEEQIPLYSHNNGANFMLRASASFFNDGKYSDEWHPNGRGWFAQNLYLDAAIYARKGIRAWTADYRISWHQKILNHQTLEFYSHIQANGYRQKTVQNNNFNNFYKKRNRYTTLGGVGMRWNIWLDENRYDAFAHKVSIGLEYQRTFQYHNNSNNLKDKNKFLLTIGVHW